MTTQKTDLTRGALVRYHGYLTSERDATFYVSQTSGERLDLVDRAHPEWAPLYGIARSSVTATGETVTLCLCGHELAVSRTGQPAMCRGCQCAQHLSSLQPPADLPNVVAVEVPGRALGWPRYRWGCTSCGQGGTSEYAFPARAVGIGRSEHHCGRAAAE